MAELENHMVCGIGFFDEEAARRRLEQMPPTKMPSDVYWEVINVVDSYRKNRRRNGDVI